MEITSEALEWAARVANHPIVDPVYRIDLWAIGAKVGDLLAAAALVEARGPDVFTGAQKAFVCALLDLLDSVAGPELKPGYYDASIDTLVAAVRKYVARRGSDRSDRSDSSDRSDMADAVRELKNSPTASQAIGSLAHWMRTVARSIETADDLRTDPWPGQ